MRFQICITHIYLPVYVYGSAITHLHLHSYIYTFTRVRQYSYKTINCCAQLIEISLFPILFEECVLIQNVDSEWIRKILIFITHEIELMKISVILLYGQ